MNKTLSLLLALIISMPAILTSCGGNEPDSPAQEIPNPDPENPDTPYNPDDNEDIPGSKILGTWYYLNPNKALKITITFSSEKGYNYEYLKERVCYVSVESKLPYFNTDYSNVWTYNDSKWEVTRIEIGPAIMPSGTVSQVFDNEMWLDLKWGHGTERLKFKRNDPGDPISPSNVEVAPDGIFGKYLWHTTIANRDITFQFKGTEWIHESSNAEVMVFDTKGNYKYLSETDTYAGFSQGYLKIDWDSSIIVSLAETPYFVVIKETDKKLKIYNPFTPDNYYLLTR